MSMCAHVRPVCEQQPAAVGACNVENSLGAERHGSCCASEREHRMDASIKAGGSADRRERKSAMGIHLDNFSDTGMAGGGGGSTFSEMGTGTQVLVGFRVFTGKWVDKIVPIFSEIAVPGWGGRDFPSPGFGGQGGNP